MRKTKLMLLACSGALAACPAQAGDVSATQMPAVVVSATGGGGTLTIPDNATAAEAMRQIPGGAAMVGAEAYEDKYSLNFEDTLAYVPGVYAQKRFGEEVRIALRGSGLSRGFHMRGLALLQDGIPFNLADGAADFQESDPLAMQRIEVFKGANALPYGSTTLGGAVNMVSKTGRSEPGDFARMEGGSFGTMRFHVQSGRTSRESDAFVSLTGTHGSGFREHSKQRNFKFNSNFGKALSSDAETRFYLGGNIIEQELPGSIGRAAALSSPKAADPSAITADQKRDIRSLRLSNKTSFGVGDDDIIDIGAFLNLKDLFHPITPFVGILDQESADYGVFAQGSGEYALAGHKNRYQLGIKAHRGGAAAKVFHNVGGSRGNLTGDARQTANNATLYGENAFYVMPSLALVTGAQFSLSTREVEDKLTPAESDEATYRTVNPKLGVLFEPAGDVQFFANISKSHEPPTFSELTQSGSVGFTPVDAQKAWTAEMGSRGHYGIAAWDISLYHAWIRDEMLQFTTAPGTPASTFNAGDTVHQGIELGLELALGGNLLSQGDALRLRGAYTFSHYYFDDDPQYGNNTIAGQPEHFLQAELRYDHPDGWHIAPNVECAGGAEVDFSNTLRAPGYGIVGVSAGYDVSANVSLFLDGRNLLDKEYISTFSTTVDSTGNTSVFYPGDGRAFFAGVKIKL